MAAALHCILPKCQKRIAGLPFTDAMTFSQLATLITIHLIDEHWDVVERIRQTTGDGIAREELVNRLASEFFT